MTQPWQTLETINTPDGALELRRRGNSDFLILINGRVLMNSQANRSELALGAAACAAVSGRPRPRVLIGGLGMGLTLRAALDALPADAQVVVAELNQVVADWCRGPLAGLTSRAVDDPRVTVTIGNVAAIIARQGKPTGNYDAIIIDLYEGPHARTDSRNDPFYGSQAIAKTREALSVGGVFAVWGENPDAGFEKRLTAAGFQIERLRPGKGGFRHVVYVAKKVK